ncbi:hypothetical protein AeMF1_016690, partial [Aphanomyces euteiches]
TKFAGIVQFDKFQFHLNHALGKNKYFLASNDHRRNADQVEQYRSGGVAMIFQATVPGFEHLHHESQYDIEDRYMVVSSMWGDHPIFYHNVYAPMHDGERDAFFNALPRNFPLNSKHVVLGDFNLPMDRELDSRGSASSNHHTHRQSCFEWIQQLNVVDAWRSYNPTKRVYSSPQRLNRLDYILLDPILTSWVRTTEYFEPTADTDHLWHFVELQPIKIQRQKSYWKLPKELMAIPEVRDAIKHEAREFLEVLRTSSEPGEMWTRWKHRTKRFLQKYHARMITDQRNALQMAQIQWLQAQLKHQQGRISPDNSQSQKPTMKSVSKP